MLELNLRFDYVTREAIALQEQWDMDPLSQPNDGRHLSAFDRVLESCQYDELPPTPNTDARKVLGQWFSDVLQRDFEWVLIVPGFKGCSSAETLRRLQLLVGGPQRALKHAGSYLHILKRQYPCNELWHTPAKREPLQIPPFHMYAPPERIEPVQVQDLLPPSAAAHP